MSLCCITLVTGQPSLLFQRWKAFPVRCRLSFLSYPHSDLGASLEMFHQTQSEKRGSTCTPWESASPFKCARPITTAPAAVTRVDTVSAVPFFVLPIRSVKYAVLHFRPCSNWDRGLTSPERGLRPALLQTVWVPEQGWSCSYLPSPFLPLPPPVFNPFKPAQISIEHMEENPFPLTARNKSIPKSQCATGSFGNIVLQIQMFQFGLFFPPALNFFFLSQKDPHYHRYLFWVTEKQIIDKFIWSIWAEI